MVATFEQLRTKNLKTFDELRAKPERPDFGMIALPRKELPGVWDYNKQLDEFLGNDEFDLEDLMPLNVRYDIGRIIGMTEKPDETKDRMKNSLYYSIQFGIPPKVSYNIIDELMKMTKFNPIKATSEERGFFGKIAESWRRGDAQVMGDISVYETAFEGRGDEEQALAALKKIQSEQALDPIEGWFLADLVYSGVEVIPGMAKGYWEAMPQAFAGMSIGAGMALAAGQVPPLTLAPEEIVGVPAGALLGGKFGLMTGSAMFWYKQGAGSMYATMRENDYNPELSKHIAGAAAVPYAIVEFMQVSKLTPGLRRGALNVAQKSMLKVVANATKKYGTVWGTEVFEEVVQEIIQIGAEDMAGFLSDKLKLPKGVSEFLLERGRRVWETTKEAGKAMALLPIPGATIDIYTGKRAIVPVEKKPEIKAKPGVVEVKAPEAPPEIAALTDDALYEKFRQTKITEPEWKSLYEEVVRRKEAETPPTEGVQAPSKPAEPLTAKIDRLQSEIDVFIEKAQKPPAELISEINAAKKELRQKPLEITGIKAKVLGKPDVVEVAPKEIIAKVKDQGKLGVWEEGLFIPDTLKELAEIVNTVRKNEGKEAADIVKSLLDKGIQTESVHDKPNEILVGVSNLSEENRTILQDAGLTVEKIRPLSGEFIRFPKVAQPPTVVKAKTIAEREESKLIERWAELDSIEKAKRKPQEIKELRQIEDELIKRHPPEAVEKDITDKARKKVIKETEEEIQSSDLYRDALQYIEEQQQALPPIQYVIARTKEEIPGEIKDYIGDPGTKGYKGYLWKYLTTYEENPNATGWDEALEQVGGRPGDIGEFIERLDQTIQLAKGKAVISQQALDIAIGQGDLHAEIISAKYEMLKEEFSATEINDAIRQIAIKEGIDIEMVESYYLPVEVIKDVKTKQQILRELLRESQKAKRKAQRPNLEEAAIRKATEIAHKTKEEQYVYERTGKYAGLFAVSKKPPTEGAYKKIIPPAKGELKGKVEEGYAGFTPEELQSVKKLRQKIHAIAINKGLTKKALSELKKKHTGYRKLTGKVASKKISLEQLQNLLKAVQKARPKKVGYKTVITRKTEKKIQSLKENLIKKTQMTERHFKDILEKEVHGKEPKYIDAKNFITETQGKDILRRMLDAAEIIRLTESFEQAIAKNPEIADRVKLLDSRIEKSPKRDPYSLESMRYYNQQAEIKTGAPIFTSYMDLMDTHLEITKTRTATWKRLESATAEFKKIAKDEAALQRVSDYIASQSALIKKPKMPKDITADEIKLAKEIQKILEEYRLKARVTKFYNWYYYNQPIPDQDRYRTEITKATDIFESKGREELIEYLETQEWGVVHSGYEPLEILFHKIRPYTTGPTAVGKGHIKIRTDIEYKKQERNILQRLSAYMRQIDMLYNLSPKINAYVRLFDDNADKFSEWGKVKNDVEIFLRNLKRYNIEGGFFERTIARAYSQAMRVIIMPSPVLSFRNLFQNAAFEHDKSILIDPRNTNLTDKDIEYLETYVLQTRAMVEEYFMVGEKPLPGLGFLTKLIDKVKIYPYSDIANRHWSFWAKTNQVDRALTAETTKQMMTEAKFEDMKELEQRRALAILARDGKEAMTQYIGRVHVDDIHFLYERAQRSPAEMTSLGKIVGNLMLFPRAYGEKLAHAANKMLKGKTYEEQWRGLKTIFAVVGGGLIVGSIYMKITGRKRNPYNPLEILAFRPGGLAWGSIEAATEIYANILSAAKGDSRALAALTVAMPRAADMFIPFYDYSLRAIEAATDQKNIDRKFLRQIRMMIDKEYKIRGGAYKVKRNTLEKWQYFIAGAGVDVTEEERGQTRKVIE